MRATVALRSLARRTMPALFGVASFVSAACVAAVASHYAIDAAGDFAVPHDTYDNIGHVSRSLATLGAAGFALVGATIVLAAAFADARRFRGALRAVLGGRGLRSPLRIVIALAPATLALLVVMESVDGRIATGLQPDLASALGGSIALGSAIVPALSALVAVALWHGLALLCAARRRIESAVGRLIARRPAHAAGAAPAPHMSSPPAPAGGESVLSRRAGKRAPPFAA